MKELSLTYGSKTLQEQDQKKEEQTVANDKKGPASGQVNLNTKISSGPAAQTPLVSNANVDQRVPPAS